VTGPATAEIDRRLAAAEAIARAAGAVALDYFHGRASLEISHKAAQDRVSEADRAVETLIRDAVAAAFPDDAFMGEEHGRAAGASGFLWVVDPIDGTTPFLSGLADWCVSVAVAVGGEPVIGVIEAPRLGETWVAARGRGATVNGATIRASATTGFDTGLFGIGGSMKVGPERVGGLVTRLMRAGGMCYHNGSGALMCAYVAAGRLTGYFDRQINAWDCFAGMVLVEEAGGRARFGGADRLERGGSLLVAAAGLFDAAERMAMAED
jgi:myo-inositol-1(or 4)-monophosphatase